VDLRPIGKHCGCTLQRAAALLDENVQIARIAFVIVL